jgi:hypothetical protein
MMILKSFEAFHGYGPKKKRVLIEQKMNFLPLLEQLPDDTDFSDVRQIDKWNAISFIKNGGQPSEHYLEKLLVLLKRNGVDTSYIRE